MVTLNGKGVCSAVAIGKIHFYLNNQLIFSEDLFTIDDVEAELRWEIINE